MTEVDKTYMKICSENPIAIEISDAIAKYELIEGNCPTIAELHYIESLTIDIYELFKKYKDDII